MPTPRPSHRLHGVLPGRFSYAPSAAAQRLTLLIAWYTTPPSIRRGGRRGQCSVPRVTRANTWPAMLLPLEEGEVEEATHKDGGETKGRMANAREGCKQALSLISAFAPAWEEIKARGDGVEGDMEVEPPSLRQHFFLRSEDDVRRRLEEEHGVGGSWVFPKSSQTKRIRRGEDGAET